MKTRSRQWTRLALLAALSLVFLLAACYAPTGNAGLTALTALCGAAAVLEAGLLGGAAVFAVAGLLGFLLLPAPGITALYLLFFGWYPLLKAAAERGRGRVLPWVWKLLGFNAALAALLWLTYTGFLTVAQTVLRYPGLILTLNLVFVLFDLGMTQAIAVYRRRIAPHTKE